MGRQKYTRDVELLFAKSPVVAFSSVERIIKSKRGSRQYAKLLVHNLVSKGKISPLTKGYYTAGDDASLAVFCFQPAYLGLQDALSFHNLWEQETIPVIITAKKIRPGIRAVLGKNVLLRRIQRKYFFGIVHSQQGSIAMPYSDVEKTFLDMLYFKEKLGKEILEEFRELIERKKLDLYLKSYPKRFRELALARLYNLHPFPLRDLRHQRP